MRIDPAFGIGRGGFIKRRYLVMVWGGEGTLGTVHHWSPGGGVKSILRLILFIKLMSAIVCMWTGITQR